VGPFRKEERAQPGAGARSGRGVEMSPVHKSWAQLGAGAGSMGGCKRGPL
jgi:hypothetical protein